MSYWFNRLIYDGVKSAIKHKSKQIIEEDKQKERVYKLSHSDIDKMLSERSVKVLNSLYDRIDNYEDFSPRSKEDIEEILMMINGYRNSITKQTI